MGLKEAPPLLEARGLALARGGRPLCRGLDLALRPGELWAVLGPNGAGKSSLLLALAGLLRPQAGAVLLEGRPLGAWGGRARARRVGLLAQRSEDPFPATVLETALLGRFPHRGWWEPFGPADREAARRALAAVDLAGLEGREVGTLSGGERRRLGLAVLLAQDPAVLLLDEPLAGLDLRHQAAVLGLCAELAARGRCVLLVLHEPTAALRCAHRALLLHGDGRVRAGPAAALLQEETLGELYGHPLERVEGPSGPAFLPRLPCRGP
ncbi:MAG: ABC transporter ATP-binding protein [Gammaproteobacteria bacterium]|nr:MAG: ABC transporter ATP-binding protein [Gammaproteobacteria bacterium]